MGTTVNQHDVDVTSEETQSFESEFHEKTRKFYDVTNELSKEEYSNIQTEWKKIEFFPLVNVSTTDDVNKVRDQLEDFKNTIIPVFDVSITSLEVIRILYTC